MTYVTEEMCARFLDRERQSCDDLGMTNHTTTPARTPNLSQTCDLEGCGATASHCVEVLEPGCAPAHLHCCLLHTAEVNTDPCSALLGVVDHD